MRGKLAGELGGQRPGESSQGTADAIFADPPANILTVGSTSRGQVGPEHLSKSNYQRALSVVACGIFCNTYSPLIYAPRK